MWVRVADPGAVAEGSLLLVDAAGKAVAVACVAGRLSAIDDRCPHFGASLSDGQIEGEIVVCPWHGREYDLRTGQCVGGFYDGVKSYPVESRSDGIFLELDE
jgi:nitrite reductase/ring-hydroxylating ferredoxin subunit